MWQVKVSHKSEMAGPFNRGDTIINKHSLSERVIVDGHGCHTALHFDVKAKENQDKVPTLYWLLKLHKNPYKARFIANSSSCTTTELSNC